MEQRPRRIVTGPGYFRNLKDDIVQIDIFIHVLGQEYS